MPIWTLDKREAPETALEAKHTRFSADLDASVASVFSAVTFPSFLAQSLTSPSVPAVYVAMVVVAP